MKKQTSQKQPVRQGPNVKKEALPKKLPTTQVPNAGYPTTKNSNTKLA